MTISPDKLSYAGIFLLKKLDLEPDEGGITIPIVLSHELQPLEPVLDQLGIEGYVELDRRRNRYRITERGIAYVGTLIDEAEDFIEEFDDRETSEVVSTLQRRHLDPMRVRFLWGWYQGEFDDLVLFQQRRGATPVEHDWALYLLSDEFYAELRRDLDAP